MFPAVERALEGKNVGETCRVRLEPEDAFGDYDAELVHDGAARQVSRERRSRHAVRRRKATKPAKTVVYTVTDIADGKVVVDGNHPLAGQTLHFACTVTRRAGRERGRDHPRSRARRARASSLSDRRVIGDW